MRRSLAGGRDNLLEEGQSFAGVAAGLKGQGELILCVDGCGVQLKCVAKNGSGFVLMRRAESTAQLQRVVHILFG